MRRKIPGQSLQPGTTSTPQPAYRVGLRQSVNRLPYPLPNVTRSATVYASGGEIPLRGFGPWPAGSLPDRRHSPHTTHTPPHHTPWPCTSSKPRERTTCSPARLPLKRLQPANAAGGTSIAQAGGGGELSQCPWPRDISSTEPTQSAHWRQGLGNSPAAAFNATSVAGGTLGTLGRGSSTPNPLRPGAAAGANHLTTASHDSRSNRSRAQAAPAPTTGRRSTTPSAAAMRRLLWPRSQRPLWLPLPPLLGADHPGRPRR